MPCRSEYMEPSQMEMAHSDVLNLLAEIRTGKPQKNFKRCHPAAYGNTTQELLNERTKRLCETLQNSDVSKYSLEMQMWWRDHQIADKERIEDEIKKKKTSVERAAAIAKLTEYERKLLNLK